MSETIEQQAAPETQPPAEDKTDAMRVQLLEAKNQELKNEKQAVKKQMEDMQRQMADLQNNQQKAKQSQLAEAGEFQTLWKEATGTVTSLQDEIVQLRQQLEQKDVAFQQQQIKATALNAFSQSGVHSPDHLFQLQKENLRLKDGNVVALVGGVEVDLQSHVESLKSPGSGLDYMFNGSGARGMSAAGSSTSTNGGKDLNSMSFTERLQLEVEQPELYARLKAAAG